MVAVAKERYQETLIHTAFAGGRAQGPTVAQFSHVQLFNPATSGRLVVVERCVVSLANFTSPCRLDFGILPLALASATIFQRAKFIDVALVVPLAQVRGEDNAVRQLLSANVISERLKEDGNDFAFIGGQPYILAQGQGLGVMAVQLDATLNVHWEWVEIPV